MRTWAVTGPISGKLTICVVGNRPLEKRNTASSLSNKSITAGPENLTATSSPWSIPVVAKKKVGDSDLNMFGRVGWHFWRQNSRLSTSNGTVELYGQGNDAVLGFGGQVGNLQVSYEHYNFSGVGAGMGIGEGGIGSLALTWSTKF